MDDLTATKYTCKAKLGDTQILHSPNLIDRDKLGMLHCKPFRYGPSSALSIECQNLQYFPLSFPLAKKEIVYN